MRIKLRPSWWNWFLFRWPQTQVHGFYAGTEDIASGLGRFALGWWRWWGTLATSWVFYCRSSCLYRDYGEDEHGLWSCCSTTRSSCRRWVPQVSFWPELCSCTLVVKNYWEGSCFSWDIRDYLVAVCPDFEPLRVQSVATVEKLHRLLVSPSTAN